MRATALLTCRGAVATRTDSWSHFGETAAPAAIPSQGEPLFRPSGIDHILVNVSNVENPRVLRGAESK